MHRGAAAVILLLLLAWLVDSITAIRQSGHVISLKGFLTTIKGFSNALKMPLVPLKGLSNAFKHHLKGYDLRVFNGL